MMRIICTDCKGLRALWLGNDDQVECPMCEGQGYHEVIATHVQARVQERFIPRYGGGLSRETMILLPHGGWTE